MIRPGLYEVIQDRIIVREDPYIRFKEGSIVTILSTAVKQHSEFTRGSATMTVRFMFDGMIYSTFMYTGDFRSMFRRIDCR